MYLMLQQDTPDDYVLATGQTKTVREFINAAFSGVDITLEWSGEGLSTVAKDDSGKVLVEISEDFYRPAEVDLLLGDPTKAKEKLGWEAKTDITELVKIMTEQDLERIKRNRL
jgi:GDPmannose 4,6-dehydratase